MKDNFKSKKLSDEELYAVSGGAGGNKSDIIYDLSLFTHRIVGNVDGTACLTLRRTPSGAKIPGVGWKNCEPIMVHREYTEDGWYFAYDKSSNKYGFVNPNCVL